MKKINTRLIFSSFVLFVIAIVIFQMLTAKEENSGNYITSLINAQRLFPESNRIAGYYFEDAASDATVVVHSGLEPVSAVTDIIKLKEKAIPLLIKHLDDGRITSAEFKGVTFYDKPINVPVGYICLDILCVIVEREDFIFPPERQNNDGLGAGLSDGYYFRPDDWIPYNKKNYSPRLIVKIVKKNWEKAYKEGKLKYSYPK
ncbi:MAG: hypothetical protein JW983_07730 [Elusimicrobia bacterium]|nr:hypothetical protein [Elusimicrobiota bacterium]